MLARKLTVLAVACLSLTMAQAASARPAEKATFRNSTGQIIELNAKSGKVTMPRSKSVNLQDCGDQFQACLTAGDRFSFSYFRNCDDAVSPAKYKRLKFRPKIVSTLHDHLWMVFDASPNLMFHYVEPAGLVGIYVGRTPSFDFRTLFRKRDFNLSDYDSLEYRIVPPGQIAACR
jgi:hypothetical protein